MKQYLTLPFDADTANPIGDDGHTVVETGLEDYSFGGNHLCAPDGTKESLPIPQNAPIYGVNDEKWVVGNQDRMVTDSIDPFSQHREGCENPDDNFTDADGKPRKGRGALGFLWDPTRGLRTFHDLLPNAFQKQVHSAVPFLISNPAQPGGKPRILFQAYNWEGSPGDWKQRTLILSWNATDEPVVDRVMLPGTVDPTTHEVTESDAQIAGWNKQHDIAAVVSDPAPAAPAAPAAPPAPPAPGAAAAVAFPKPSILRPYPFAATTRFSEGFDPPMVGDVDALTGKKDGIAK